MGIQHDITVLKPNKNKLCFFFAGIVQRALRERGGDVRLHPQLQRVLRRERREQAGPRVSQTSQRNHLRF